MTGEQPDDKLIGMTNRQEPGHEDTNHCQKDRGNAVVPLEKVQGRKKRHTEKDEASERENEEAGPQYWLGPVADTVLVDFLFYGLFIAVPVLLLWILFGRWWIFRNFEWVALGVGIWFVLVLGWRRKNEAP